MADAPTPTLPMAGRRVLVTGATSGIGERTAYNLSVLGAEVLLVGRNPARVEAIRDALARNGGSVAAFVADMSDRDAIRTLARDVTARYTAIDGLVNNAGGIFYHRRETASGSEWTFAVNVEGPFLLTELLLPALVKSGHGRVVHVSSAAHRSARMHFDDLDARKHYSAWRAYGQSKLALILLTREEARVHRGLPVTFNACHPGFVRSRFGDEGGGMMSHLVGFAKSIGAVSVERGARTPTFLASAPEVEGVTGEYFIDNRPHAPSRRALRAEDGARLWALLESRTGLTLAKAPGAPGLSAPVS